MLSTKGSYPSKSVISTKGVRCGNGRSGRLGRHRALMAERRIGRRQLARMVDAQDPA